MYSLLSHLGCLLKYDVILIFLKINPPQSKWLSEWLDKWQGNSSFMKLTLMSCATKEHILKEKSINILRAILGCLRNCTWFPKESHSTKTAFLKGNDRGRNRLAISRNISWTFRCQQYARYWLYSTEISNIWFLAWSHSCPPAPYLHRYYSYLPVLSLEFSKSHWPLQPGSHQMLFKCQWINKTQNGCSNLLWLRVALGWSLAWI